MRVNEIMARVEDIELIYLHAENFGIMNYKYEIMKDKVYKQEHFGDYLVTDICVQEVKPNVHVLAISAFKPSKENL